MTVKKIKTVAKLERLLHKLNERGEDPTVAVLDSRGIVALAYGIELGDEMGTVSFTSPGDDRERGTTYPGEGNRLDGFERDLDALRPPFIVLYPEALS